MKRVWALLVVCACCMYGAGAVESVVLVKSDKSWDGSPLPSYPKEAPEISVLKITIPPHTELPVHQHPIINVGYMLKGTLKVVTDTNDVLYLKAGDAIIEVVDKWHSGMNEGDEPVEIVVVYAGVKHSLYSIKQ